MTVAITGLKTVAFHRLRAIYRSPRTSRPVPEHRVHPYLLGKIRVTRPNQA